MHDAIYMEFTGRRTSQTPCPDSVFGAQIRGWLHVVTKEETEGAWRVAITAIAQVINLA